MLRHLPIIALTLSMVAPQPAASRLAQGHRSGDPIVQISADDNVTYRGKHVDHPAYFHPVLLRSMPDRGVLFLGPEDSTVIFLVDVLISTNARVFARANAAELVAPLSGVGSRPFDWKEQEPPKLWGRYDKARSLAWAYNGDAMVVFEVHLFVVHGHSFILGIADCVAVGPDARGYFDTGPQSASFAAIQAIGEMIPGLTGDGTNQVPGGVPGGVPVRPN